MKRLHYLQHVPFEDLGCIRPWAEAAGLQVRGTRFFRHEALPTVDQLDWLVIMGGPMNVYQEKTHPWLREEKRFIRQALETGKIVIGICLGAQLIAAVSGVRVHANGQREIGWFPVYKTSEAEKAAVAEALPDSFQAFHWHGDTFDLPAEAIHLGRSAACEHQGFVLNQRVVGLQYHLEVTHDGLKRLIHHCRSDIDDGLFVQQPAAILADPERIAAANSVMNRVLERLAELDAL